MSIYFTEKKRQWLIDIQKRYLISLANKLEMKIKTTMRYHFIATRMAKNKNSTMASVAEDVHQQNLLYTATISESVYRCNYLIK